MKVPWRFATLVVDVAQTDFRVAAAPSYADLTEDSFFCDETLCEDDIDPPSTKQHLVRVRRNSSFPLPHRPKRQRSGDSTPSTSPTTKL